MANGLLVHGLDYDDTHVPGIIHATASAFPCTFALGERLGASGEDVIAAYVVAVEAGARIGTVPRGGFHRQGFQSDRPRGCVRLRPRGGPAPRARPAAARHGSGDRPQHRLGEHGVPGGGAWTKRLHPGWAAVAGLTSAYLASEGFVAPSLPTRGVSGSNRTHLGGQGDDVCDYSLATHGLGETWELERVAVKPFPACHFLHGCADAAIAIADSHDLRPDEVEEVTALVPEETIATICEPAANKVRPTSDYDAKFSVQYAVAASLARRAFGLAELDEDARTNGVILELAKRVRYRADPASAFPRAYSGEGGGPHPGRARAPPSRGDQPGGDERPPSRTARSPRSTWRTPVSRWTGPARWRSARRFLTSTGATTSARSRTCWPADGCRPGAGGRQLRRARGGGGRFERTDRAARQEGGNGAFARGGRTVGRRREHHPRRDREVPGEGGRSLRARPREGRRLSRGHRGGDEGSRTLRRDHPRGVRRPRPRGGHLRPDRGADGPGMDVDHRDLQLSPHHGLRPRASRDRGAEARVAAEVRDRRDPGRARPDRARRGAPICSPRSVPLRAAAGRATSSTAPRRGSRTGSTVSASPCSPRPIRTRRPATAG